MRSAALTLAASALAASALATPAMAQAPQDEVAQLRALLRQQAAAMQVMQQRLNAIEARQRSAAARAAPQVASQAGTVAVPDPGEPRSASGGADQGRRSIIREPAPGGGGGARVAQSGTVAVPDPGEPRSASGGADQGRRPIIREPAPGGGGAGIVPASPEGRPGPEAQPTPAGTVESSPRQQAATTGQAPAPAAGNPPLAVLSGNDRVQVTLSGQVNRDILFYNDGSGRTDTYFADNNVSSTRLRALGSARLDKDTIAISAIEFDLRSNSSAQVTRQSSNNNGGDTPVLGPFRVRRAEVGLTSAYGSILLGRGSTFTDGIAEFDLSGTDVAFYSYLPDSGGALQFSNRSGVARRAGDPTISQVYDDFDGPREDRIRYDTPIWHGLSAGGSVGQGGLADVGLRYAATLSGVKIAGGIGYINYQGTLPSTQPQDGTNQATTPFKQRVAGSVAALLPNGLNFLVSAGWGEHYGGCCGPGLIARNDAQTYFLKAGYQANIFNFGPSNFAVQGGQAFNRIRDGDVATRVGLSFNQQVIAKGFEVYGGYEHLMLTRAGPARYAPADIALIGSRVQF